MHLHAGALGGCFYFGVFDEEVGDVSHFVIGEVEVGCFAATEAHGVFYFVAFF